MIITSHRKNGRWGLSAALGVLMLCPLYLPGHAQSFKQDQFAVANGADSASSASFATRTSIGQNVIGMAMSANFVSQNGFLNLGAAAPETFDLTFQNFAVGDVTVGPGSTTDISFDLINNGIEGTIAGGSYSIEVYLSSDQIISTGEGIRTFTISSDLGPLSTYVFPQSGDNASITIPNGTAAGSYFILIRADSNDDVDETDETNNDASFAITVTDDATPPIIGTIARDLHFSVGSTASVSVTDNVGVATVNFYHRGITTPDSQGWGTAVAATLAQGVYSVTLEAAWLDNIGVEYWFEAFDASNNRDTSEVQYTYFQTAGGELTLPGMKSGRDQSNYEMISIPFNLSSKNPESVFSVFGAYNRKTWRMFHYVNGATNEFRAGWTQIELGKSYWIINDQPNAGAIFVGEGKGPTANKTTPQTLNLVQGWNQIGNPYRFDVTWADILTASGNPAEAERFRVWTGGALADGTILETFGGGFVFTSAPVTLEIPVTSPPPTSSIVQRRSTLRNPLDSDDWEIDLSLVNEDFSFNFAGIGMREDASIGKDPYDEVGSPHLIEYLETRFEHPEYFIDNFSKEVVPSAENYVWEFTVETNAISRANVLGWDNSYFGENDKDIFLVDVEKQRFLDMKKITEYGFSNEGSYRFKVIYGNSNFVEEVLQPDRIHLGRNYPNPLHTATRIPFSLPESGSEYQVEIRVLNHMGQYVNTILNSNLTQGFYEAEWDRSDANRRLVPPGIYVYQLIVENKGQKVLHIGRMSVN